VSAEDARISAATVSGALRGMETFAQWIDLGRDGFQAAAVHIDDSPRFPWRGLMLDVSRHWMPVDVVLRNLDAMAAVKLNVFHWHLSDDQGFRVESRRFPRLQGLGSDGHFYTQAEVRRVIEYARDRGIRVIPEFDMPGHTTSWFVGYPELASATGAYQIERKWGIFQPTMDPSREQIYAFLDQLIGEMAALFPDPFFHIGGDEVDATEWNQSTTIQAWAARRGLKDAGAIQGYFNRRVAKIVASHGKMMIGWDEAFDSSLPHDTVIQSWRGQASLADVARAGFRGVLSFGYYLDHLKPASLHYGVDPLSGAALELSQEQKARILGGEACMWSEYVDAETIDSRVWPSAAAIAERLWSQSSVTDVDSMYQRLEEVSRMLDWAGLKHRVNYEPMLERLAGERPSDSLRILADASEALGIEGRRDARHYTSLVDLNRFVDAARPES
jgi:hexosaminidase